ncbi:redox-regulated ATPase YchF, partial [Tepidanaerobacter acetatoxydans]|uniref:redox-regulated ATPase YchF n=1 Tax=Tepidanaerobacter acetatoxydans TaxID=499229 RepID=UPI001BD24868
MKVGLVGLPTVGKTTFFNLLTNAKVETSAFQSGKINANFSLARVPDERVDFLAKVYKPKKVTYAQIEVIDIPGLVSGASEGKGSGNQFLDNIRKVDCLVHIVRAFSDESILHPEGSIDVIRDIENIGMELLLADLQLVETRIERIDAGKKITKELTAEREVLQKLREALENEIGLSDIELSEEEQRIIEHLDFLTVKPVIIVINVDEQQLAEGYESREKILNYCKEKNLPAFEVSAKAEVEISELDEQDRAVFMKELNIKESGIDLLARAIYEELNLISFLTAGEDEVKAWTITRGTNAKAAAGKIHSDIERGFIRAEVINFKDFKECGNMVKARELGKLRLEGKEYIIQDGDIINFR